MTEGLKNPSAFIYDLASSNHCSNNLRAMGLYQRDISLHTLRHTYATDELRNGETNVKTISDSVVHSQISTTIDIYAASTTGMKQAAAERRQTAHDRQKQTA